MKINLARKKLLEGGIISGPSLYYPSPEIAEEAVQHGFDFVWIDWQHGAWSESSINASMAPLIIFRPCVRLSSLETQCVR